MSAFFKSRRMKTNFVIRIFKIRAWSGCNSPWGSDSRITPDSHSITRVVDATHSSAMIIFIFMFNWSSDREIFVKRENIVADLATKVNWQWQTEHMQRGHQTLDTVVVATCSFIKHLVYNPKLLKLIVDDVANYWIVKLSHFIDDVDIFGWTIELKLFVQ